MNTAIYEGYKTLPYGENFLNWLKDMGILDEFINEVEARCGREDRSNADFYINRCRENKIPSDYITLSLYFRNCANGHEYWAEWHNKWTEYTNANDIKIHAYVFDLFRLARDTQTIAAFSQEEAETILKKWLKNKCCDCVGYKFSKVE